jgi:RNA polymerase sigma-70 factor (sigma-E family)
VEINMLPPGTGGAPPGPPETAQPDSADGTAGRTQASEAVTALYQAHAVGLIRLGVIMLGDRHAAEDVVQDAFCGLYRRWHRLADQGSALCYVRSSVLNGCRSALRRSRRLPRLLTEPAVASAETDALIGEDHRAVLAALRKLPLRQREALVLRYFAELPESEIARTMGISAGTVKSTTSRAIAALGRMMKEEQ